MCLTRTGVSSTRSSTSFNSCSTTPSKMQSLERDTRFRAYGMALAVEIAPQHRGRGLSRVVIGAMRDIARRHGFKNLIAPVRPSWKERYPLTPIEKYISWTTDGGQPFDPWIRVHHKLGADILKPVPRSLQITGTVREWEEWTEMSFPESGIYVFPRGLAPLAIDVDGDLGRYWEPNVWMRHPVDP
jgi:GNAT superfamily N-acetyltransferase